ncbi:MAG: hypothetical protein OXM61_23230 [Candidatus Poribacteria bacterium]|nr:hypothetical protein [Candidatus Poribacteria bacterium]
MLVSAVPDPSAFDASHFNAVDRIQAEVFLDGIERNGLLIVDSGRRLQNALISQIKSLPDKFGQQLQIKIAELLLKKKTRRTIAIPPSSNGKSPSNLLDLALQLKTDTKTDALIVGEDSLKTLKSVQKDDAGIVPLSEYRDSDFEKCRQRYVDGLGPIDTLPRSEVDKFIKRTVRFTKWLRFYDPYIGKGNNTGEFREGIEYILSLWEKHGFFASQKGTGSVEIYTSRGRNIQIQHERIVKEIITPIKSQFPWPIKFLIKINRGRIFHARYLETQHAIIRVDKGFDLFEKNGQFKPNLFTLNMTESRHVGRYRNLPDAIIGN